MDCGYIVGVESAGLADRFDVGDKDDFWIFGLYHSIREETLKVDQI